MWKALKIKSSVLQLSILVAVLVGILLLSFIALTHTHAIFRLTSKNLLKQLQLNEATFYSEQSALESSIDSIDKTYGFRGGFQKLTATINTTQGGIKKIGLVGAIAQKENQTLFLKDNQNPLVLVGDAIIVGSAKIPKSGIKSGVISGTYFQGDQLINGSISYSSSNLPQLENGYKSYLSSLLTSLRLNGSQTTDLESALKNSFLDQERIVFDKNKIVIFEEATGNIRFQSNQEIVVKKESRLTDVILVAPIITIEKGFKGRVHLIARDSIIIEKNVSLEFPSSLILSSNSIDKNASAITIQENSSVSGAIIYLGNQQQQQRSTNIRIDKGASVNGGVYCEGYLEHYGTIRGNVYTSFFITKASGSSYINHLMNGKIYAFDKNQKIPHLPLKKSAKSTVQWLY